MVLWGIDMNYSCNYAHVLMERNEELRMVFELVYAIYIFNFFKFVLLVVCTHLL